MDDTRIGENLVAYARGELPDDERRGIDARLREDAELRAELDAITDTLRTFRDRLPAAPEPDMHAFKAALFDRMAEQGITIRKPVRVTVAESGTVTTPSRRSKPVLLSRRGFMGFEWRWNWVPYAISTCVASLVLTLFNFIHFEHAVAPKRGKPRPGLAATRAPAQDGLYAFRLIDNNYYERNLTMQLAGRTFAVQGLDDGTAYLLGDRVAGPGTEYLQLYSESSWNRLLKSFGETWPGNRDYAKITVSGGRVTVPERLFSKYLGQENTFAHVRILIKGDLKTHGFAEVWNPSRYRAMSVGSSLSNAGLIPIHTVPARKFRFFSGPNSSARVSFRGTVEQPVRPSPPLFNRGINVLSL